MNVALTKCALFLLFICIFLEEGGGRGEQNHNNHNKEEFISSVPAAWVPPVLAVPEELEPLRRT